MNSQPGDMLLGLILGWLTLILGLVLYLAARGGWRRWRYGTPADYNAVLTEYSRKMTGALDPLALRQLLTAELPRALQISRAALLLPEAHRLVAAEERDVRLPISHAAVRWVASGGIAQRADRGRLRELLRQGQDDLAWACVWVPLMRGADLRGLWLLGTRDNRTQYAPEDLTCLTDVGRQAAVVLEAMHYAERERQAAAEMRALYHRDVSAQEAERNRLARDLHDGVLQDLCAVTRDLKALEAQPKADQAQFSDLAARSGEAVHTLRTICHDLRPPLLQHDLVAALKALVEQLDTRSTAPVGLDVSAGELRLPDDAAVAIFRITQEALNNAIQHADASEIVVRLTQYPDRLRLTVTDDGRGIPVGAEPGRFVAQGHLGLAGMRERAAMIGAKLDVQSAPDYGTVVILELPHQGTTMQSQAIPHQFTAD
jgi:two-component system sensor histidine kinase DegS